MPRPKKYQEEIEDEDDELDEFGEDPEPPRKRPEPPSLKKARLARQAKLNLKKPKPVERFELVHQTELLGIRDNETEEVTRFAIEQEIIDIKNKLDKIIKGGGFE